MPGIDAATAQAERDDGEGLSLHARYLHAGRSERHPADCQPAHAFGTLRQNALHVSDRNMALEGHAVDDGGMTGYLIRRDADATLQSAAIGIVDDPHLAAELLADLHSPLLAATTPRIAVHGDVGCSHRGRGKPHQQGGYRRTKRSFHHRLPNSCLVSPKGEGGSVTAGSCPFCAAWRSTSRSHGSGCRSSSAPHDGFPHSGYCEVPSATS